MEAVIIKKDSGITQREEYVSKKNTRTTFRLIGEESDISSMTAIVVKQPADVWPTDGSAYTGNWIKKVVLGVDTLLDSDNRELTVYGAGEILFDKTANEQVGVVLDQD